MGAKFGNIQVLNTSVEELQALLPKTVVGRWSERFVTALSEDYQLGTVEREGQKLSRKVAGPVLAVGLFDDDLLSLTVYQGGKRLTEHVLNPYDGINKAGNPAVFCAALGLPAEDEKRLRAVWKKGDATEQLNLTQKLLAAPLWCDENWQPDTSVTRDAEAVDCWLNERPEPPKLKNKTKVELIQELRNYMSAGDYEFPGTADDSIYCFYTVHEEGGYVLESSRVYTPEEDGRLSPREGSFPGVIQRMGALWRKEGCTPCFYWDGRLYCDCKSAESGMVYLDSSGQKIPCAEKGQGHELLCAEGGSAWFTQETRYEGVWQINLVRRDKILRHQAAFRLMGWGVDHAVPGPNGTLLFAHSGYGLWLFDAESLAVRATMSSKENYGGVWKDSHGRFWVLVGNSTLEGYDKSLQLLSRHRVKGRVIGCYCDSMGGFCAVTTEEAQRNNVTFESNGEMWFRPVGRKRDIVRVYRIT